MRSAETEAGGRSQGGKLVVVTGGSGFLGRHLIEQLLARGHMVRVLTRGGDLAMVGASRFVEVHDYDGLTDVDALERAFRDADVVVHLAARVHVLQETVEDPLRAFRKVNVEGTGSVLAAARRCRVQHLVFLSSVKAIAESSSPTKPLDQYTDPAPSDPYGISKLEAERLLERSARDGEIGVTVLRPPLVYGPGVSGNMIRLFELVSRAVPLPFGGVENRRSLLYVGNLTFAIAGLVESEPGGFRQFFVSDTADLSTPDLLHLIGVALDRPVHLVTVPYSLLELGGRVGDVLNRVVSFPLSSAVVQRLTGSLVVDSTPLWRQCGRSPPFTPQEGLLKTGAWFRVSMLRET